jgi:two-component system OmpR family response regulator/two-component system copper resistance phosphate regulon response regulator CusR
MNILIVEDDPGIGKSLARGFEEHGNRVTWVRDGRRGLVEGQSLAYDAIILDLMLPELPGISVLRELRASGARVPVILLTALGSVEERVAGLNAGADDYLVKPFSFAELEARLDAVHRRSSQKPSMALAAGDVVLDLTNRKVTRGGLEIQLTPTEFSILELLLRHSGQVVTRSMLCRHLWDADWEGATNVIEVHIKRLRSKVEREGHPTLIQTVRGRGYAIRAS